MPDYTSALFQPLTLPCGVRLKNRIAKSAMSDSLGDGTGHPTPSQIRLYERWAEGGTGLSIVGEVQGSPHFAEKPGNLVLDDHADLDRFRALVGAGTREATQFWPQLGHAGAMAFPPTSRPAGPSALDQPGLTADGLSLEEIAHLPARFAETARLAMDVGFTGVQIHAAHGFLLSQFLSPLFNRRRDAFGGSLDNRMRLLLEVVEAVRQAIGPHAPIAVKLNATDQLEGGFDSNEALDVIVALDATSVDLIDISGGTYFPGAKSASDGAASGPYFLDFAGRARRRTGKPLMVTGGFKTLAQATQAIASGAADVVGLARALALMPDLPNRWRQGHHPTPTFPRFDAPPEGGVTAWYTMQLTALGQDHPPPDPTALPQIIAQYQRRDQLRTGVWNAHLAGSDIGRFPPN